MNPIKTAFREAFYKEGKARLVIICSGLNGGEAKGEERKASKEVMAATKKRNCPNFHIDFYVRQ